MNNANFENMVKQQYEALINTFSPRDKHLAKLQALGEGKHDANFVREVWKEYDRIQAEIKQRQNGRA
jgi:hypothetical protein